MTKPGIVGARSVRRRFPDLGVRWTVIIAAMVATAYVWLPDLVGDEAAPAFTVLLIDLDPAQKRFVEEARRKAGTVALALERSGIDMPPGSSAVYQPETVQLIVRHTKEGHRRVRTWVEAAR